MLTKPSAAGIIIPAGQEAQLLPSPTMAEIICMLTKTSAAGIIIPTGQEAQLLPSPPTAKIV